MNDNNTKQIVKDSILKPSDSFTDALMEKIAIKKKPVTVFPWAVLLLSTFCLVFVIYLIFLLAIQLPEINIYNYSFNISPIYIQIIGSLFTLYVINQIYQIYRNTLLFKQASLS